MHRIEPSSVDVLDALPLAVVVVDGAERIQSWNGAAEVLYGHRRGDVLGQSVVRVLFEAEDRESATRLFSAASAGEAWAGDRRVRRSDGMLLVSSFAATPAGQDGMVAWVATDGMDQGLAEQERSVLLSAEHAARDEAEKALGLVEAIITSAPVGIAVFDLDLRYVRVNDAFAALSGVPAAAHVGGRVGEVVPLPSDVGADLRRVVTTGRTILARPVELDDVRDDTARRHFTVSYFPIRTSTGVLVGAGATVVEVTEAKRAEAERAALLLRAESAQRRLAILATASTVLTTTMDVGELLARLARVLTPSAADWSIIQLFGASGSVEHVAVSHRDRAAADELAQFLREHPIAADGDGPVAAALRTGEARLIGRDALGDATLRAAADRGNAELAGGFTLQSSVIVPIEAQGKAVGVLILSTDGDRTLEDDDLDLAVEVAHRGALALGNARAFQQEHQIAGALQRALLPAAVPSVPGLDIAVRYLAATDGASVGGDWYDVIGLDDGLVGLVVGDVVGHDINASTSMGQLRSALRAYACEEQPDPSAALARVDRIFDALGLTYATCVLGMFDPHSRTLRWSNAGHPPPLLVRDGVPRFLDDAQGIMLGVTGGTMTAESSSIELQPGDLLLLYTDGLIERRGESITVGLERLADNVVDVDVDGASFVCDALLERMAPQGTVRGDDVALLAIRVEGEVAHRATHRLELAATPESAAAARGFTAGVLGSAGWDRQVDTAVLLVSELVTNAVRHGNPPYTLVIAVGEDEVELSVEDADPSMPTVRDGDALAEEGRGFVLIGALAAEWGVRPMLAGKAAWFTLRNVDAQP